MPSYVKKKTSFNIADGLDASVYEDAKLQFPDWTGADYSEAHDNYTKNFFQNISYNNRREDDDEMLIWDKVDSLKSYIYVKSIEAIDAYGRLTVTIEEFFKDEAAKDAAEGWLKTTNVFENDEGGPTANITYENVDWHKPYKS